MPRPRRSEDMIVRVARMRYEQRLPQTEIARLLEVSEATVSRCLKTALDLGFVEIQVAPKAFRDAALERRVKLHLGLRFAVVVEERSNPTQAIDTVGKAVARVIEDMLKPGDVLGVSDGATVAAIAGAARKVPTTDLDVVALVGGIGAPEQLTHSSEVCRRMAAGLGARAWQMPVPALVDDRRTAKILHDTAGVRGVFQMMRKVTFAVVGVGSISPDATIFREGFIDQAFMDDIRARGAVGTICARFFGRDGHPVGTGFDDRTMSISLEDLAAVPVRLAAAISPDKAPAIRAAVEGGLVNAVATDAPTARALLAGR
ncbi:sugar-binding transcriptional regulator [Oharaeibacter diazotrophicus]|uniref:DNA-binding transcriptional regulator LsrR (DeoR family) n=1 Tax=Oharaeibacter diazotrophicus TaxID=1920512 RepID=A0A4R6RBK8_9HYPH|nr:sugar-binding domain-containing protein [Oharaeibacter diazotrophicus]TDP83531.1 DNA-binding transcriptional regulator LsrR (DeoR family) [Oharaeibacter diazotrophicus]BBE72364.1 deoxyribonucleoside regulator [Pleomorphomonas sp. SM30]